MPRRTDGAVMDLGDILSKDQIITDLQAGNRWEAIDELIKNLVDTGKIKPEHLAELGAVQEFGNVRQRMKVFLKLTLRYEKQHDEVHRLIIERVKVDAFT